MVQVAVHLIEGVEERTLGQPERIVVDADAAGDGARAHPAHAGQRAQARLDITPLVTEPRDRIPDAQASARRMRDLTPHTYSWRDAVP
jgi:hypothetical protein